MPTLERQNVVREADLSTVTKIMSNTENVRVYTFTQVTPACYVFEHWDGEPTRRGILRAFTGYYSTRPPLCRCCRYSREGVRITAAGRTHLGMYC